MHPDTLAPQICYPLIINSEHASKSVEQQEACLRKLGVIHDQAINTGGIAASILSYLVSRRRELQDRAQDIVSLKGDLVRTFYDTKADQDLSSPICIHLSQSNRERAQSLFIATLQYDGMIDRESRIATVHEATFQWVFQDKHFQGQQSQVAEWSNLREWFESDEQLYWITGKAGSGKSTLMKYLCSPTAEIAPTTGAQEKLKSDIAKERCRCHPFLKKWVGPSTLVVASFYFWNSGMEIQMTQMGLLRTLLYQIVAQRPDIIPIIASKHWESLCLFDHCREHFSAQELHDMLFRVIKTLANDSKICFFVDGLDEFGHNHEDLISMVKDLISDNGHTKICVASRPWNIFQDSLGKRPSLRLEDLTFNDIKTFVESKFHADTEFENLRRRYPPYADQLMENIVVKASGVFLWVDLVVASLLGGMRLGDRIQDFQRRLDELPPKLEELFEKILHSLDQFYLSHAAQYFALVESATIPLTILQFTFADEESPESALKMLCGSMTEDDISLRIEAMNRRLNSRCKGFLETDRGLQGIQAVKMRPQSQLTVQYLHRTVRDFIKSPKAQKFLQSSTDPDFDPSVQLCVAYLMDLKTWKGRQDPSRFPKEILPSENIFHCFRLAAGVSDFNEGAMISLLDELKTTVRRPDCKEELAKKAQVSLQDTIELAKKAQESFQDTIHLIKGHGPYTLSGTNQVIAEIEEYWVYRHLIDMADESSLSLAVRYGVVPYVRARAERGGLIRRPDAKKSEEMLPLLLVALSRDVPEPKTMECLLDLGADPSFKISKVGLQTPWTVALTKVSLLPTIQRTIGSPAEYLLAEDKWKQTLRLMYSKGAGSMRMPDSLLTPISRKILQDLEGEVGPKAEPFPDRNSWLRAWNLG